MIEEVGCDKDSYDQLLKKVGVKSIYEFITKYGTGMSGLCHYIDVRKRFMPPKYTQDYIAKTILDSLKPKEKMMILSYVEDLVDGEF
jgi:hypothetical protein